MGASIKAGVGVGAGPGINTRAGKKQESSCTCQSRVLASKTGATGFRVIVRDRARAMVINMAYIASIVP